VTGRKDSNIIELMEAVQISFDYPLRENRIGEADKETPRPNFDRTLNLLKIKPQKYVKFKLRNVI
jgi:hypothetical protein